MRLIIEKTWNLFCERFNDYKYNNSGMHLDLNKKHVYEKLFNKSYSTFKKKYMHKDVKYLDRHKIASLMIISFIESNAITYKDISEDCIFIGLELISLEVGISYMLSELNAKLKYKEKKLKHKEKIINYSFPKAFSCPTDYLEIMARILYLSKRDFQLNPLDLSERLFLLEYITLKDAKVDMSVLREY